MLSTFQKVNEPKKTGRGRIPGPDPETARGVQRIYLSGESIVNNTVAQIVNNLATLAGRQEKADTSGTLLVE
jgi:hypothetical protein